MDGKQRKYTVDDIRAILSSPEGIDTLSGIEISEVPAVVDLLHIEIQAIVLKNKSDSHDDDYRKKCIKCLQRLIRKHHILPESLFVDDIEDPSPVSCGGGYCDIYQGTLRGRSICLKVLRVYVRGGKQYEDQTFRAFYKEALVWTQFNHPNILPFIGVNTKKFDGRFCLVSPWMVNGEITKYLERNPRHDKLTAIIEIAAGMSYLHSIEIVHADIKGANVLVDNQGHCQLADFGLAAPAVANTLVTHATDNEHKGTIRWMAPEVFGSEDNEDENEIPKNKKEKFGRDIYAYAMTIVEIITGQLPFPNIKHDAGVMRHVILNNGRPKKPLSGIWCPDTIWLLLQYCWKRETDFRPSADNIHSFLLFLQDLRNSYLPWESTGYIDSLDKEASGFQMFLDRGYDGLLHYLPSSSMVDNILLSLETAPKTLLSLEASKIDPVLNILLAEAKSTDLNDKYSQKCMKFLRQLVNQHCILPSSLLVSDITGEVIYSTTGLSDIYKATYQNKPVYLKVMRKWSDHYEEFYKETLLWTQLNHPNILPFLGVNTTLFPEKPALVAPWMENREITEFLKVNPTYDRLKVITEIAAGIMYLHSHNIVHGDIKGANVLVDEQGQCYLADFQLATVAITGTWLSTPYSRVTGTLRWMAPELFASEEVESDEETTECLDEEPPENPKPDNVKLARDIYAYACTVYEIVAEKVPFAHLRYDSQVMIQVVNGKRPERPTVTPWCPNSIWALIQQCWVQKSHLRPTAAGIHAFLVHLGEMRTEGLPWEEEFPNFSEAKK